MDRLNEYALGDLVVIEVRFYLAAEDGSRGDLTDPIASTASIRWRHDRDDAVERTLDDDLVQRLETGVYATEVLASARGRWNYRGESTVGLICASAPRYFTVVGDPTR